MYMPLCRECHARESKLNSENAFIGDPSKISAEHEKKQFTDNSNLVTPVGAAATDKLTPNSSLTGTTASGDSPKAKSFSSEDSLGRDEESEITLRRINTNNQNRQTERHRLTEFSTDP